MYKTLIGKDGYLFLHNDSAREIECHNNNLDMTSINNLNNIKLFHEKYLLIVLPNKSLLYKQNLQDGYDLKYRPAFDKYSNILDNHILDSYSILSNIFEKDVFYKTDTHMNLNGMVIIYNHFIDKVNNLFNLNIVKKSINLIKDENILLSNLNLGIGDLTWSNNLGNQVLTNLKDNYYYSNDFELLYCKHVINNDSIRFLLQQNDKLLDETSLLVGQILEWNIISKYILYKKNENSINKRILIFYDSFLLSTLSLYLNMFSEVYMIKNIFNPNIINVIKPDFIFEFRVERFLL